MILYSCIERYLSTLSMYNQNDNFDKKNVNINKNKTRTCLQGVRIDNYRHIIGSESIPSILSH